MALTYRQLKELLKEFTNEQLNQEVIVYDAIFDVADEGVFPMRADHVPEHWKLANLASEDRIVDNQIILVTNIPDEEVGLEPVQEDYGELPDNIVVMPSGAQIEVR